MKRLYESILLDHFQHNEQMAFLCGPRQVGKTTLSKTFIRSLNEPSQYLNWDNPEDRLRIIPSSYEPILERTPLSPATHPIIIFDEIHKYSDWKNYLKGFYDAHKGQLDTLVTGSARLNVFRKDGDSLMGRYFLYRVHPISCAETPERSFDLFQSPRIISDELIKNLLHFGGFPEPFTKANDRFLNRWRLLRQQQLIFEDIRSLEAIHNLNQLDLLANLLQNQAGQLINYTTLASKVKVSVPTIQRWISVLEENYYCYTIRPWSTNVSRSLLKEPKIYLWDWSLITDIGARHENFVASHLLKAVHFWTDIGLGTFNLHFIRTKDQNEVDFLVTKNNQPWMIIEVKTSIKNPLSKALRFYQESLKCPFAFQVVFDLPGNDAANEWLNNVINQEQNTATIIPIGTLMSILV